MSESKYTFILSILFNILGKVETKNVWSSIFFLLSIGLGIVALLLVIKEWKA